MWINALRLTCFIKLNSEFSCDVLCGDYSNISHCSMRLTKSKGTSLNTGDTTKTVSHGGTTWPVQGLTRESCCPPCLCCSLGRFYNLHSVPCSTATLLKIPKFGPIELAWSHHSGAAEHNRAMDSNGVSWSTGPEKCVSIWIWHCFVSRDNSNKLAGVI